MYTKPVLWQLSTSLRAMARRSAFETSGDLHVDRSIMGRDGMPGSGDIDCMIVGDGSYLCQSLTRCYPALLSIFESSHLRGAVAPFKAFPALSSILELYTKDKHLRIRRRRGVAVLEGGSSSEIYCFKITLVRRIIK